MALVYHRIPLCYEKAWEYASGVSILATDYKAAREKYLFVREEYPHVKIFFDNAVFEGTPISVAEYLSYVEELTPDLWVVPDVFGDFTKTYELVSSLVRKDLRWENAVFVVPELPIDGDRIDTRSLSSYLTLVSECGGYVGVPYVDKVDRLFVLYQVVEHWKYGKGIHLLGIERPLELFLITTKFPIMSIDTSIALTSARERRLLETGVYAKESIVDINDIPFDPTMEVYLLRNMYFLDQVGNYGTSLRGGNV